MKGEGLGDLVTSDDIGYDRYTDGRDTGGGA